MLCVCADVLEAKLFDDEANLSYWKLGTPRGP
jgi:hypothetical protein